MKATRAHHLVWPVGAIVVVVSAETLGSLRDTTYAGTAWWMLCLEVVAAAALLAGAVLAGGARPGVALPLAATGLLWLVPEWAGQLAAPVGARVLVLTLGQLVLPAATLATLAVVLRAWPTQPYQPVATRLAMAGGVGSALLMLTLVDPFRDVRCWRVCDHHPWLLADRSVPARWAVTVATVVAVAGAILACAACLAAVARHRRRAGPAAASLLVLGGLAFAAVLRLQIMESPDSPWYRATFVAAQLGALGLVATVVADRWREWQIRSALLHLVAGMRVGGERGALSAALAHAVHDPDLLVLYWSAARSVWVDATGAVVDEPAAGAGRSATEVVRNGEPVATIFHSAALEVDHLERVLGPALRLSIENERLHAATLAELAELKLSRTRIVEATDEQRRQLERNLHDGAQQRLVGLALVLRMLRTMAQDTAEADVVALAAQAEAGAHRALAELRRVARGIYPALLSDAGLAEAVWELAEASTDVALRVDTRLPSRPPPPVEAAVYLAMAVSLDDARSRAATRASVSIHAADGVVRAEMVDDGRAPGEHPVRELADRVGALDGRLQVRVADGAGSCVIVEVPCES
jgi:signal transduction histidine kinase